MLWRHSRDNIDGRIMNIKNEVGGTGCTGAQSFPVFSIWLGFARAARRKRDRAELILGNKWNVRFRFGIVDIDRRKKSDAVDAVSTEDVCAFIVVRDTCQGLALSVRRQERALTGNYGRTEAQKELIPVGTQVNGIGQVGEMFGQCNGTADEFINAYCGSIASSDDIVRRPISQRLVGFI
jgi:hypothetical protein